MRKVHVPALQKTVSLQHLLGSGGEGDVFEWEEDSSYVCKLYHAATLSERGQELSEKLKTMTVAPPSDPMAIKGTPTFAWPKYIVCDPSDHKRLVGFLMPRIVGVHEIHELYSRSDRSRLTFTSKAGSALPEYKVMCQVARNLAEAFNLLHAKNYVMVDVNEKNICFRTNATVAFFDNDSFQVEDPRTGNMYRAEVGRPEYWPPESPGLLEANLSLGPEHDRFALGVFIFRLLMDGSHPFHGRSLNHQDPVDWHEHAAAGRFMYDTASAGGYSPPPSAPPYQALPASLRELFRRCFVDGCKKPSKRPSADEWVRELDSCIATIQLCNVGHAYFGSSTTCPWCDQKATAVKCSKCGKSYVKVQGGCPFCAARNRTAQFKVTQASTWAHSIGSQGTGAVRGTGGGSGTVVGPGPGGGSGTGSGAGTGGGKGKRWSSLRTPTIVTACILGIGLIARFNNTTETPYGEPPIQDPQRESTTEPSTPTTPTTVSTPTRIALPDLAGKDVSKAKEELASLGLTQSPNIIESFSDMPSGTIVEQSPSASTSVEANSIVWLTVSKGPDTGSILAAVQKEGEKIASRYASLDSAYNRANVRALEEFYGSAYKGSGSGGSLSGADTNQIASILRDKMDSTLLRWRTISAEIDSASELELRIKVVHQREEWSESSSPEALWRFFGVEEIWLDTWQRSSKEDTFRIVSRKIEHSRNLAGNDPPRLRCSSNGELLEAFDRDPESGSGKLRLRCGTHGSLLE